MEVRYLAPSLGQQVKPRKNQFLLPTGLIDFTSLDASLYGAPSRTFFGRGFQIFVTPFLATQTDFDDRKNWVPIFMIPFPLKSQNFNILSYFKSHVFIQIGS